jgi:outer membrane protein assembly factor BamB
MSRRRFAATTVVAVLAAACGSGSAMSGTWSEDRVAPGGGAVRAGDAVVAVVLDEDGADAVRPTGGALVGYDHDGAERWRWDGQGRALQALPVADDAVVVLHHTSPPPGDGTPAGLCAVAVADGSERWCEELGDAAFGRTGAFAPTAALSGDGAVVTADAAGIVRAVDLGDGSVRWEATVGAAPDGDVRAPGQLLVAGDLVIWSVAADDSVVALDLGDGSERWRSEVAAGLADSHGLVLTDELVLVQGVDAVAAFDRDGGEAWRVVLPDPPAGMWERPDAGPVVHGETLVTVTSAAQSGTEGRVLHGLDVASGELRWTQTEVPPAAESTVRSRGTALTVVDERLLLLGRDVTEVDPASGELSDTVQVGMSWPQDPGAVDGRLVVVDADGRLRTVTPD